MNNVNLIGYIENRPPLEEEKSVVDNEVISTNKVSFRIVIDDDKAFTKAHKTYVNCKAYGEEANYIYRNCLRGTLVEITGSLESINTVVSGNKKVINYVEVAHNGIRCLVKREIVVEEFDKFIAKYSKASIKEKMKSKIKEEKKKDKEESEGE